MISEWMHRYVACDGLKCRDHFCNTPTNGGQTSVIRTGEYHLSHGSLNELKKAVYLFSNCRRVSLSNLSFRVRYIP